MNLIYFDESGQSGNNLSDPQQPIFVLAALVVPEEVWLPLEATIQSLVDKYFPTPRPLDFEIHATKLRNGNGYFRQFAVGHRLSFRDDCLRACHEHGVKLIYRPIAKVRFKKWVADTFGTGVSINPHYIAFSLVARVVDDYLKNLPGSPLGIFISDENREIIQDVEKVTRLLRSIDGPLKLCQIIEKGFFIDSAKSLVLQMCDLCAYSARKKEEAKAGMHGRIEDQGGIDLIEPLIHRGDESLIDTLEWVTFQRNNQI